MNTDSLLQKIKMHTHSDTHFSSMKSEWTRFLANISMFQMCLKELFNIIVNSPWGANIPEEVIMHQS